MQWQFRVVWSIRQQALGKINALLELRDTHDGRLQLSQTIAQLRYFIDDGVWKFAMLEPPDHCADDLVQQKRPADKGHDNDHYLAIRTHVDLPCRPRDPA